MGNLALPSFQHSKWKTKKVSFGTKIGANLQTGKLATYCRKIYSDTFVRHKVLRSEKRFPTVFVIFARLYLRSANTLKISTAQGPNTSLQNRHFTAFWKTKYEMVIQKANIAFDLLDSCKHQRYCWATFFNYALLRVSLQNAKIQIWLLATSRTGRMGWSSLSSPSENM